LLVDLLGLLYADVPLRNYSLMLLSDLLVTFTQQVW